MKIDSQLEDAFRVLMDTRTSGTVSVNEAAKHVGGPRWRSLAIPARRVAHRMAQSGEVIIASTTVGQPDVLSAKSPVRIRRPR